MAVTRQANLLSQQRFDIPHIRGIESAVAGDFDVLAGRSWAGQQPLVIRGFQLTNVGSGAPATSLQLSAADGIVFNSQADESGTMLWVPADRAVETLNPVTNPRVIGGWTPGGTSATVNYVGLLLTRNADASTTDLVQFLDSESNLETPKQVPLAKTLDYQIQIGTVPFSGQPDVIPLAKVSLDSSGHITAVQDARPMSFRLGAGGDSPNPYNFFTGWTRKEGLGVVDSTLFQGGDKQISSLKQWQDAVMTRIWEGNGGEFWYSATADRNVELTTYGSPLGNGEYFSWNLGSSTLTYQNLRFLFDNSTAYSADIGSGTAVLNPGDCLYVDIDRTQFYAQAWVTATVYAVGDLVVNNSLAYECTASSGASSGGPTGTGQSIVDGGAVWRYVGPGIAGNLTPIAGHLATLGTGSPAGSRWILAWRRGAQIFTRGWRYPVGTTFQPATTTSLGEVELIRDSVTPLAPTVMTDGGGLIQPLNSTDVSLILKAFASGTADLQQWQSSAGTTLTSVSHAGDLVFGVHARMVAWPLTNISETTTGIPGIEVSDTSGEDFASLSVNSGTAVWFLGGSSLTSNAFTYWGIDGTTSLAAFIGTPTANPLDFHTGATPRWRVDHVSGGDLIAQGGTHRIQGVSTSTNLSAATSAATDASNLVTAYKIGRAARNLVINGGMDFWQRNITLASPAGGGGAIAISADRWGVQADSTEFTATQQTDVPNGAFKYSLRLQRNPSTTGIGPVKLMQELDRQMVRWHTADTANNPLVLSFWIKVGANFTGATGNGSLTVQIHTGTGTENVAYWGPTGYVNDASPLTPQTLTPSTSWQRVSFNVSDLGNGGGVTTQACLFFRWQAQTPTTAGANDWMEITGVMLTPQQVVDPTYWVPAGGDSQAEFILCQRYYEKSYDKAVVVPSVASSGHERYSQGAAGHMTRFKVSKVYVPLTNVWTVAATPNKVTDLTAASELTASTSIQSENSFLVQASGGSTSDVLEFQWAADAEIYS